MIDEHETTQNHNVLQENSRDYKSFDDNVQSENLTETHTESINELIEPEKLVSSTSEESSTKLLLTTALSTKLERHDFNHPLITSTTTAATTKIPSFYKTTQNYSNYAPNWRLRQHYSDQKNSQSSSFYPTDLFASTAPTAMIMMRDKWRNKSGCFYSCIQFSKGLQTVLSKYDYTSSIRLCEPTNIVSYKN